jgi:hypothetical protein
MLNIFQPAIAATRPLGGFGTGAVLCEGYGVGSVGIGTPAQALPRVRRVGPSAANAGARGVSQHGGTGSAISQQFSSKQHTTRIDPAYRATLGPHPAREPEPT